MTKTLPKGKANNKERSIELYLWDSGTIFLAISQVLQL
jgi:hypothetical protein